MVRLNRRRKGFAAGGSVGGETARCRAPHPVGMGDSGVFRSLVRCGVFDIMNDHMQGCFSRRTAKSVVPDQSNANDFRHTSLPAAEGERPQKAYPGKEPAHPVGWVRIRRARGPISSRSSHLGLSLRCCLPLFPGDASRCQVVPRPRPPNTWPDCLLSVSRAQIAGPLLTIPPTCEKVAECEALYSQPLTEHSANSSICQPQPGPRKTFARRITQSSSGAGYQDFMPRDAVMPAPSAGVITRPAR
jgi:hypothetical protein